MSRLCWRHDPCEWSGTSVLQVCSPNTHHIMPVKRFKKLPVHSQVFPVYLQTKPKWLFLWSPEAQDQSFYLFIIISLSLSQTHTHRQTHTYTQRLRGSAPNINILFLIPTFGLVTYKYKSTITYIHIFQNI